MPIGLGTIRLTMEGRPEEADAIRTIHAALDAGCRLIDTAVNYCASGSELGYCEALVRKALKSWSGASDDVLVVCKGGNLRTDEFVFVQDGSPANLRRSCEISLKALGRDVIDLYCLHSIDPNIPLADSMSELARLREEGKIRHIGISNAGRRQIAEAQTIVELAAVENRLSPWSVNSLPIVAQCQAMGLAYLAYSPLGSERLVTRLGEKPAFAAVAHDRGVSVQQVALAWALAVSPIVIPIPSARRPDTICESLAAASLLLSPEEMVQLQQDLTTDGPEFAASPTARA